jgi:hypothetical protein
MHHKCPGSRWRLQGPPCGTNCESERVGGHAGHACQTSDGSGQGRGASWAAQLVQVDRATTPCRAREGNSTRDLHEWHRATSRLPRVITSKIREGQTDGNLKGQGSNVSTHVCSQQNCMLVFRWSSHINALASLHAHWVNRRNARRSTSIMPCTRPPTHMHDRTTSYGLLNHTHNSQSRDIIGHGLFPCAMSPRSKTSNTCQLQHQIIDSVDSHKHQQPGEQRWMLGNPNKLRSPSPTCALSDRGQP